MSIRVLAFMLMLVVPAIAQAQTSKTKAPKPPETKMVGNVANGFRVAVLRPSLKYRFEAESEGRKAHNSEFIDETWGLSAGYAYIPVRRLGFVGSVASMELEESGQTLNLARAEGNIAYAFNNIIYIRGGLNFSGYTSREWNDLFNPSFGVQAAGGVQINRYIGAELGFTIMNQTGEAFQDRVDLNTRVSGLDLSLHATF